MDTSTQMHTLYIVKLVRFKSFVFISYFISGLLAKSQLFERSFKELLHRKSSMLKSKKCLEEVYHKVGLIRKVCKVKENHASYSDTCMHSWHRSRQATKNRPVIKLLSMTIDHCQKIVKYFRCYCLRPCSDITRMHQTPKPIVIFTSKYMFSRSVG